MLLLILGIIAIAIAIWLFWHGKNYNEEAARNMFTMDGDPNLARENHDASVECFKYCFIALAIGILLLVIYFKF